MICNMVQMTLLNHCALLALILHAATFAECERGSTGSIMEMINPKAIKELLQSADDDFNSAEVDEGHTTFPTKEVNNRYKVNNDDNSIIGILSKRTNETSRFERPEYLVDIPPYRNDRILKSTRTAITLTLKKDRAKDWCIAEPLKIDIREKGCIPKTIKNRYCHGLCSTYYVPKEPRNLPSKHKSDYEEDNVNDEGVIKFCAMCKPMKTSWKTVTLDCPFLSNKRMRKRVLKVKKCRCMAQGCN